MPGCRDAQRNSWNPSRDEHQFRWLMGGIGSAAVVILGAVVVISHKGVSLRKRQRAPKCRSTAHGLNLPDGSTVRIQQQLCVRATKLQPPAGSQ